MSAPVVAAIDPRRPDAAPALLGAQLAGLLDAPLLLVSAYPVEAAVDVLYPEYARVLRLDAERALRQAQAAIPDELDAAFEALGATGSPAAALQQLAERLAAPVLVVGSSAGGDRGRLAPGAVTDRLLDGAPCPVAVAPAGYDAARPLEALGAAFVERPDGVAAVAVAGALAELADARVRVLMACEPLDGVLAGTLDGLALADATRDRELAAERSVRRGVAGLPAGRSSGGRVLTGRTVDVLAAASAELDLLVCGSRGHGPAGTLLLGGAAHALVRRAACPVLVVPPGAAGAIVGARATALPA